MKIFRNIWSLRNCNVVVKPAIYTVKSHSNKILLDLYLLKVKPFEGLRLPLEKPPTRMRNKIFPPICPGGIWLKSLTIIWTKPLLVVINLWSNIITVFATNICKSFGRDKCGRIKLGRHICCKGIVSASWSLLKASGLLRQYLHFGGSIPLGQ